MSPSTRSDARRNRERLLEAAAQTIGTGEQDATLDAVARSAGVGIGTLYRHFPTREALVAAVYENELQRVCDRAPVLLRRHEPDVALRRWMDAYAAFVRTKQGMAQALRDATASGALGSTDTRARVNDAVDALLTAGARAGTLRDDIETDDVTTALVGIMWSTAAPERSRQTARLLDLLVAGLTTPSR